MNDSETIQPERVWFDIESLPSWLVSLITHMGVMLLLGLLIQSVPKEKGVELTLNYEADPGLTRFDAGGGGNGGDGLGQPLDESIEAELDMAEEAIGAAEVPIEGELLSENADANLGRFCRRIDRRSDGSGCEFAPGRQRRNDRRQRHGRRRFGDGTGGGHGAGEGTGTGDGKGPGPRLHEHVRPRGRRGELRLRLRPFAKHELGLHLRDRRQRSLTVTPLEAAKNELIRSIGDLNDGCRFQIVFYNDIAVMFGGSPTMYTASYANKELAKSFVENMKAEANTNHSIALENALQCNPDMIFLMTDGEAKDDLSPSDVRRLDSALQEGEDQDQRGSLLLRDSRDLLADSVGRGNWRPAPVHHAARTGASKRSRRSRHADAAAGGSVAVA